MKPILKIILYCTTIMILSTLGITYWYISDHLEYDITKLVFFKVSDIQIHSLKDIIIEIGMVGALIPTFLFLILYFLKLKIKNVWLFSFLTLLVIIVVITLINNFILNMMLHEFSTPIQFK